MEQKRRQAVQSEEMVWDWWLRRAGIVAALSFLAMMVVFASSQSLVFKGFLLLVVAVALFIFAQLSPQDADAAPFSDDE